MGHLAGLSSGSVTSSLLGLIFAFGGGSAIAFQRNLDEQERSTAGKAIFALAASCLVGVYSGIFVTERQLLSPASTPERTVARSDLTYLRANIGRAADVIDQQLANNEMTPNEAYRSLFDVLGGLEFTSDSIRGEVDAGRMTLDRAYAELGALVGSAER